MVSPQAPEIRLVLNGTEDVTDRIIVQREDGWHIRWEEVPKSVIMFHLNLLHPAFMRKKPYPSQADALKAISQALNLRFEQPARPLSTSQQEGREKR